jgi:transcriptional regulator with XRE-family HTH domain
MDKKDEFSKRLIVAMQKQGYKPEAAVLEREFNLRHFGKSMTLHGVNKWLKGESIPPYDKIITIATWLKVPPEELTFGLAITQRIKQENNSWKEAISYQEREIFEAFLSLPAPQRKVVREVIIAFAKASKV